MSKAGQNQKRRLSKPVLVSLIVIGALLVAGGGYLAVQRYFFASPDAQGPANPLSKTKEDLYNKAVATVASDGAEQAQSEIGATLETLESDEDKSYAYTLKASLAPPDTSQSEILGYYYEAEKLDPTFDTALNVATAEYYAGNKENALKYYKLYLERSIDKDGKNLDPQGRAYYEARVKELEA